MAVELQRLAKVGARLGEAPLWLPKQGYWLWLDLHGRQVLRYDPRTGENRVILDTFAEDLGCLVRWMDDAALLVSARGFHRLSLETGRTEPVPCPIDLPEGTIFNDGKVDPTGGLWLGSSDAAEAAPTGRLWRVAKGQVTEVAAGFAVSNGPSFAPDGRTAYFSDTFGGRILRFDLDPSGAPVSQSVFAAVPAGEGYPDGMTVDRDGTLHVGHWEGARISRWSPAAARLADMPMPALNVTSLAFGGSDMQSVLVTTAGLFPGQAERQGLTCNGDLLGFQSSCPGTEEPGLAVDWLG